MSDDVARAEEVEPSSEPAPKVVWQDDAIDPTLRVVVAPDKSIGTFMIYVEERDEDGLGAETWVEVDFGINDDADGQLAVVLLGLLYKGNLMPEWASVDDD